MQSKSNLRSSSLPRRDEQTLPRRIVIPTASPRLTAMRLLIVPYPSFELRSKVPN